MPTKNKIKRCIDYEYVEMNRADIHGAIYNPRKIKDKNRSNLKKSLSRFGIVEAIIVNKRSKEKGWVKDAFPSIVGGHQRISVLDEKNKTDQYIIGVNMIDVDEKEEKALNLALNNKNLQGDYDEQLLKDLSNTGVDLISDGFFDKIDIEMMYGLSEDIKDEVIDDTFRDAMNRNKAARETQKDGAQFDRVMDRTKLTIVFENNRERDIFDKLLYLEKETPFIEGYLLIEMAKKNKIMEKQNG